MALNYCEIALPRPKDAESKAWEERLAAEGLRVDAGTPPPWHRCSATLARSRLYGRGGHVSVQLPDDWRDGAEGDFANRVLATAMNREIADVENSRLSDYVWHEADWCGYPAEHRVVMEAYVIDGPSDCELARRAGISVSGVSRILRLHRELCGLVIDT